MKKVQTNSIKDIKNVVSGKICHHHYCRECWKASVGWKSEKMKTLAKCRDDLCYTHLMCACVYMYLCAIHISTTGYSIWAAQCAHACASQEQTLCRAESEICEISVHVGVSNSYSAISLKDALVICFYQQWVKRLHVM